MEKMRETRPLSHGRLVTGIRTNRLKDRQRIVGLCRRKTRMRESRDAEVETRRNSISLGSRGEIITLATTSSVGCQATHFTS